MIGHVQIGGGGGHHDPTIGPTTALGILTVAARQHAPPNGSIGPAVGPSIRVPFPSSVRWFGNTFLFDFNFASSLHPFRLIGPC